MSDSDGTLKGIQRKFHELQDLGRGGQNDGINHEYVWLKAQTVLAELGALIATREVQLRYEREFALRNGVVKTTIYGRDVDFSWRDPTTGKERQAEVYANAHNNGETYGLKTWDGHRSSAREVWHRADWPYDAAFEAARAWVNDGEPPRNPLDLVREIMDR